MYLQISFKPELQFIISFHASSMIPNSGDISECLRVYVFTLPFVDGSLTCLEIQLSLTMIAFKATYRGIRVIAFELSCSVFSTDVV